VEFIGEERTLEMGLKKTARNGKASVELIWSCGTLLKNHVFTNLSHKAGNIYSNKNNGAGVVQTHKEFST
jgi:hypothetical protein